MTTFQLRRSRPEDAEALLAIRSHPLTQRYQPMQPGTLTRLRGVLAERALLPLDTSHAGKLQWTILVNDRPAGWVSLDIVSREHRSGNIGYALDPAFHGAGVTSGGLRQVVTIAFDPVGLALERLQAVAAIDNIASCRVLEKCGFTHEGIARGYLIIAGERVDHARYGLLRDDIMLGK